MSAAADLRRARTCALFFSPQIPCGALRLPQGPTHLTAQGNALCGLTAPSRGRGIPAGYVPGNAILSGKLGPSELCSDCCNAYLEEATKNG